MIEKQFEFNKDQSIETFEMVKINSENDSINYDICIYGSSDFHHNGRHPPHFHIFDDNKNPYHKLFN